MKTGIFMAPAATAPTVVAAPAAYGFRNGSLSVGDAVVVNGGITGTVTADFEYAGHAGSSNAQASRGLRHYGRGAPGSRFRSAARRATGTEGSLQRPEGRHE